MPHRLVRIIRLTNRTPKIPGGLSGLAGWLSPCRPGTWGKFPDLICREVGQAWQDRHRRAGNCKPVEGGFHLPVGASDLGA